jgi:hypothetical protein
MGNRETIIKTITMQKNSQPVYYYDSETKKYIKPFTSKSEAERELNLYRGAVGDAMKGRNNPKHLLFSTVKAETFPEEENKSAPVLRASNTLTEDQLREKHDMFFMIFSFVKGLPSGRFIDEPSMLRQLSLLGKPRYREALSRPELKEYKGRVDGVVYYGSTSSIKKLKSEGVLQ